MIENLPSFKTLNSGVESITECRGYEMKGQRHTRESPRRHGKKRHAGGRQRTSPRQKLMLLLSLKSSVTEQQKLLLLLACLSLADLFLFCFSLPPVWSSFSCVPSSPSSATGRILRSFQQHKTFVNRHNPCSQLPFVLYLFCFYKLIDPLATNCFPVLFGLAFVSKLHVSTRLLKSLTF